MIRMDDFFQKNGLATMKLARELILSEIGTRILTISEYSEIFEVARGTIQMAIKNLVDSNSIQLDKRGHLGTYLMHVNFETLWQYTGWNTLSGAMPLPVTKRLGGLTTGICKIMKDKEVPFNFAFMQGSESRMQAMRNFKYDFIIVSKLTAQHLLKKHKEFDVSVELLEHSYADHNVLVFAKKEFNAIEDGMRIAYDEKSADQKYIVDIICKDKKIEKVNVPYIKTRKMVIKGEVDATIYRRDAIVENNYDLKFIDLPDEFLNVEDTKAVLLINKNNYGIKRLLEELIKPDEVQKIQKMVMTNEMEIAYY